MFDLLFNWLISAIMICCVGMIIFVFGLILWQAGKQIDEEEQEKKQFKNVRVERRRKDKKKKK